MTTAAIYTRVSTTEQAETGYGLASQLEKCKAMATVKGWHVVKHYSDDVSGTKSDREGLNELLMDSCSKKFDAVIVAALDRLGRSTKLVLNLVERLDACGVEIVSVKESLDTSTPTGNFVLTILAAIAQLERDNIVARTTDGRDARGKIDGEKGGRMPLGYQRAGTGEKNNGEVVVNEKWAKVVRRIFALRAEGQTMRGICTALNETGQTTKRGSQWTPRSVKVILDNREKYEGGTRGESDKTWPAILEPKPNL